MLIYQLILKLTVVTVFIYPFQQSVSQSVETDGVYKTKSFGFSQAVISNGFVFLSGQVGWNPDYHLPGKGDFEAQAIQSFKNIERILASAGSSISRAVHLRFFVTRVSDENKKILTGLLKKYFPDNYQPTTTLLCVKSLARKELIIEIEAISALSPQ
jgi:2-iminobutanoate/2-iminopropanoate deaminase